MSVCARACASVCVCVCLCKAAKVFVMWQYQLLDTHTRSATEGEGEKDILLGRCVNESASGFVPIVSWRLLGGQSSSRVAAVTLAPDFELELQTPRAPVRGRWNGGGLRGGWKGSPWDRGLVNAAESSRCGSRQLVYISSLLWFVVDWIFIFLFFHFTCLTTCFISIYM